MVAAHRSPQALCANCIDGTEALRPRQLDPGGPIFLLCPDCDPGEGEAVRGPRGLPVPPGGEYRMSDKLAAILLFVSKSDWASCIEICDALGIPEYKADAKARNAFSANLCRLHKKGFIERRRIRASKFNGRIDRRVASGGHTFCEYRVTELGAAVTAAIRASVL